jgi:hypothetical protein
MDRSLPIPEPATAVAILIGADSGLARRLTECYARLGSRIVAPLGDEPADLVIVDSDVPGGARRVHPGGTLAIVGPVPASARLETPPLVLGEIDVVLCSPTFS